MKMKKHKLLMINQGMSLCITFFNAIIFSLYVTLENLKKFRNIINGKDHMFFEEYLNAGVRFMSNFLKMPNSHK